MPMVVGRDQPGQRRHRLAGRLARPSTAGDGSYGVHIPIAIVVDLDFVENGPDRQTQAGIGDARQQPQRDRRLGAGPPRARRADRRAGRHAGADRRRGAGQPPRQDRRRRLPDHPGRGADPRRDRDGGLRLVPPGQRRLPRDLARDRPALARHWPRTASRWGSARCSAPSCAATPSGSPSSARCLRRHGLPVLPGRPGPERRRLRAAVAYAPSTRPDRYTILEHLDLPADRDRRAAGRLRRCSP